MLAQDNSAQLAATPELNVSRGAVKTFQFFKMITISGKQSDKEVETSFDNLMQMYIFVIEVLQNSKYHYLAPP